MTLASQMAVHKEGKAGSALEVLRIFTKLGVTCFGGPIAHIGYFRHEFVVRRQWLDNAAYANLVGLCQFLPGPASSQVGFSLGLMRAGYLGGLAAWTGFTLPSAILLVLFAYLGHALHGPVALGVLHGFKLVAVAIVANAVRSMARALCPDLQRASIAVVAGLIVLMTASSVAQIVAITLGGIAGFWLCRADPIASSSPIIIHVSRSVGFAALAIFIVLLGGLPVLHSITGSEGVALFDAFYRSGALVFGGGHVVLPLLHEAVVAPGWISDDTFLIGYGATQAVPGPLFTFSAYLGTLVAISPHGVLGAITSLIAIFLPGLLVLTGALPFWEEFRRRASAQAIVHGVNASVVGLLGAALYNPVWTGAVRAPSDVALVVVGFLALALWRLPPWTVIVFLAATGALFTVI
jgi:chromate transporter